MTQREQEYLSYYRKMVMIRQFETLAGELFAAGKIPGFIHLSIGQEASAVGVCSCLRADDYLTTTHRGHGHMISKGADIKKMVAELFGKATGYCRGKGGSMHIADFSSGILGANGVVAGGLPIITGAGFSIKLRKTDQVSVCFFGDGASNRGTVHESMNMASIWKLPVIFVVENNQYASTTPQNYACSVSDISKRASGYNMPGISVDGNNLLKVREVASEAVQRARKGEGPSLIESKTYRFRGHYEGDPQSYRTEAEITTWKNNNDPVKRFADDLSRINILTPKLNDQIWDEIKVELGEAVAFADASPLPEPTEALQDLFVNP